MTDLLIKRELVRFYSGELSMEEIFRKANDTLLEKGYVCETYLEALLAREEAHPTAIQMENINIAIPHAAPIHVKRDGILAAALEKPAAFCNMIDGSRVEVEYVFFLILTNGNSHLDALSCLMTVMQEKESVEKIRACRTEEELYETLKGLMEKH